MERGLRSPAFAAVSLGSNALFSWMRRLFAESTHPVIMHAIHGISARPLLCQWLRVRARHRCLAALRPLLTPTEPAFLQQCSSAGCWIAARVSRPRAYGMIRRAPRGSENLASGQTSPAEIAAFVAEHFGPDYVPG